MAGVIRSIAIGQEKGKPKQERKEATLFQAHGLVGDAHAGPGPRQVGLLSATDFDKARRKLTSARPGSFAENLILEGVDFSKLQIGDRLRIGGVLIEIAERGKAEWKKGDYSFCGVPLLAKKGLFARVLSGGKIKKGDTIEVVKSS